MIVMRSFSTVLWRYLYSWDSDGTDVSYSFSTWSYVNVYLSSWLHNLIHLCFCLRCKNWSNCHSAKSAARWERLAPSVLYRFQVWLTGSGSARPVRLKAEASTTTQDLPVRRLRRQLKSAKANETKESIPIDGQHVLLIGNWWSGKRLLWE